MKNKNLNDMIDDLLSDIILPTETQIREETKSEKIKLKLKGKKPSEQTKRKYALAKIGKKRNNDKKKTNTVEGEECEGKIVQCRQTNRQVETTEADKEQRRFKTITIQPYNKNRRNNGQRGLGRRGRKEKKGIRHEF